MCVRPSVRAGGGLALPLTCCWRPEAKSATTKECQVTWLAGRPASPGNPMIYRLKMLFALASALLLMSSTTERAAADECLQAS